MSPAEWWIWVIIGSVITVGGPIACFVALVLLDPARKRSIR